MRALKVAMPFPKKGEALKATGFSKGLNQVGKNNPVTAKFAQIWNQINHALTAKIGLKPSPSDEKPNFENKVNLPLTHDPKPNRAALNLDQPPLPPKSPLQTPLPTRPDPALSTLPPSAPPNPLQPHPNPNKPNPVIPQAEKRVEVATFQGTRPFNQPTPHKPVSPERKFSSIKNPSAISQNNEPQKPFPRQVPQAGAHHPQPLTNKATPISAELSIVRLNINTVEGPLPVSPSAETIIIEEPAKEKSTPPETVTVVLPHRDANPIAPTWAMHVALPLPAQRPLPLPAQRPLPELPTHSSAKMASTHKVFTHDNTFASSPIVSHKASTPLIPDRLVASSTPLTSPLPTPTLPTKTRAEQSAHSELSQLSKPTSTPPHPKAAKPSLSAVESSPQPLLTQPILSAPVDNFQAEAITEFSHASFEPFPSFPDDQVPSEMPIQQPTSALFEEPIFNSDAASVVIEPPETLPQAVKFETGLVPPVPNSRFESAAIPNTAKQSPIQEIKREPSAINAVPNSIDQEPTVLTDPSLPSPNFFPEHHSYIPQKSTPTVEPKLNAQNLSNQDGKESQKKEFPFATQTFQVTEVKTGQAHPLSFPHPIPSSTVENSKKRLFPEQSKSSPTPQMGMQAPNVSSDVNPPANTSPNTSTIQLVPATTMVQDQVIPLPPHTAIFEISVTDPLSVIGNLPIRQNPEMITQSIHKPDTADVAAVAPSLVHDVIHPGPSDKIPLTATLLTPTISQELPNKTEANVQTGISSQAPIMGVPNPQPEWPSSVPTASLPDTIPPRTPTPTNFLHEVSHDPGVQISIEPNSAHMAISSTEGDLSLHVRVRDGQASIHVAGTMAPLFESREPEMRQVLASEGLQLGNFVTTNGGQENGSHHPSSPEPPVIPTLAHSLPVKHVTTTVERNSHESGHIHITA